MVGPPARWIAPSTPPPPVSPAFAALTIASADWRVMSPSIRRRIVLPILASRICLAPHLLQHSEPPPAGHRDRADQEQLVQVPPVSGQQSAPFRVCRVGGWVSSQLAPDQWIG